MHKYQKKLLKLIDETDLNSLSLRQIGKEIGGAHPQTVKYHLTQLEKNGQIKLDRFSAVQKTVKDWEEISSNIIAVPIIGSANCGEPSFFAEENYQGYLHVSRRLLTRFKNIFAIEAVGTSLNMADINGKSVEDGDYLIVTPIQGKPNTGDYILSVIDGFANIKRFIEDKINEQIVLISESTYDYPPIYIHEKDFQEYFVNGVVLQVIKSPKLV